MEYFVDAYMVRVSDLIGIFVVKIIGIFVRVNNQGKIFMIPNTTVSQAEIENEQQSELGGRM